MNAACACTLDELISGEGALMSSSLEDNSMRLMCIQDDCADPCATGMRGTMMAQSFP